MADKNSRKIVMECNEKEMHLLEIIRQTEFGEIRIIVQEGCPIRIEEVKRSIKL